MYTLFTLKFETPVITQKATVLNNSASTDSKSNSIIIDESLEL